ncbi:MAG: hypothetical protein K9L19_13725, partial [Desulfarculaceae bacterium]|nr:hypothetical protein [Desulfarculaceae bacterium]MCF8124200.1 hypothetical protein [Desulfarculaceae bacterium]
RPIIKQTSRQKCWLNYLEIPLKKPFLLTPSCRFYATLNNNFSGANVARFALETTNNTCVTNPPRSHVPRKAFFA